MPQDLAPGQCGQNPKPGRAAPGPDIGASTLRLSFFDGGAQAPILIFVQRLENRECGRRGNPADPAFNRSENSYGGGSGRGRRKDFNGGKIGIHSETSGGSGKKKGGGETTPDPRVPGRGPEHKTTGIFKARTPPTVPPEPH